MILTPGFYTRSHVLRRLESLLEGGFSASFKEKYSTLDTGEHADFPMHSCDKEQKPISNKEKRVEHN